MWVGRKVGVDLMRSTWDMVCEFKIFFNRKHNLRSLSEKYQSPFTIRAMENIVDAKSAPILEGGPITNEKQSEPESGFPWTSEITKTTKIIVVCCIGAACVSIVTAIAAGHARGRLPLATSLIAKPFGDTRSYQFAQLHNGIRVVNVHDNSTQQSAFAVAVKAGSFNDPKELPGLAHFCEHMLFMGTEKYPDADGFSNFMAMHAGMNNAFTAYETTVYYGEMAGRSC